MKTSWIDGLAEDKKEEMQREFNASALLRQRLSKLSQDKIETATVSNLKKQNYLNASWPYQQADNIGYERALREIISLLD